MQMFLFTEEKTYFKTSCLEDTTQIGYVYLVNILSHEIKEFHYAAIFVLPPFTMGSTPKGKNSLHFGKILAFRQFNRKSKNCLPLNKMTEKKDMEVYPYTIIMPLATDHILMQPQALSKTMVTKACIYISGFTNSF